MKYGKIKIFLGGILITYLGVLAVCTEGHWSISDLRCEYLQSPINIDALAPRFTWRYEEGNRIRLSVMIPDNATATVYPDRAQTVGSGNHEFVFTSN